MYQADQPMYVIITFYTTFLQASLIAWVRQCNSRTDKKGRMIASMSAINLN